MLFFNKVKVLDVMNTMGDIRHIFPRAYLKKDFKRPMRFVTRSPITPILRSALTLQLERSAQETTLAMQRWHVRILPNISETSLMSKNLNIAWL